MCVYTWNQLHVMYSVKFISPDFFVDWCCSEVVPVIATSPLIAVACMYVCMYVCIIHVFVSAIYYYVHELYNMQLLCVYGVH